MKTFTITFDNKNDMDASFDNLFELFKDSDDFKSGNILMCKTTEDGTNRIYLHVLDKAADSINDTVQRYIDKEKQSMSKDYSNLEGLIGNVKESIKNAYDKGYKQGFKDSAKSEYEHDHAITKAYNDGQAYILDKIRAEIEKESEVKTLQLHWGEAMGLNRAKEIIDKYRGDTDENN